MVKFRAKLKPSADRHAQYSKLFDFYRGLYSHLKDDFVRMSELRNSMRNLNYAT
jgi:hypothetical protein